MAEETAVVEPEVKPTPAAKEPTKAEAKAAQYNFDDLDEDETLDEGAASPKEKKDDPAGKPPDKDGEGEAVKPPEFSDELLTRAVEAGLTDKDVREFGSSRALKHHLDFVERFKKVEAEKKPKEKEAATEDEEFPELSEAEDYDPKLVKGWNKLTKTAKELREKVAGFEAREKARSEREASTMHAQMLNDFDEAVDGLGDEYAELLGKGEIKEGTKPFENRAKLFGEMHIIAKSFRESGKPVPGEKELLKRAVANLFSDETETIARKKLSSKLETRKGAILPRPTQRNSVDKAEPDKAARSFVKAFLKDKLNGKEDTNDEDEEL